MVVLHLPLPLLLVGFICFIPCTFGEKVEADNGKQVLFVQISGIVLGGKVLIIIGRWCSWQPLTNHKSPFSTERNPEILAPKANTHSAYSL